MSTYAMDCLEQSRNRTIRQHSDAQLDLWIERAADHFGEDFWLMLHGIDAYAERRRRRAEQTQNKRARLLDNILQTGEQRW